MSSFTEIGYINGPIMGVPEDYVPEVVLSDEEFEAIYAARGTQIEWQVKNKNKFLARDYSLNVFSKVVDRIYEDDTYGCPEELLMTDPHERLRALFWAVNSCSCCITHCHKCPKDIDTWRDRNMADRFTAEEIESSRCHCHCRMWKRKLRRAFFRAVPGQDLSRLIENESDEDTRSAGSDEDTRSAGSESEDDCEC